MPSIEQLNSFNERLVQTGNEPQIAADRGQEIEAVPMPGQEYLEPTHPASTEDFLSALTEGDDSDFVDEELAPPDDLLAGLSFDDEESPEIPPLEGEAEESLGVEDFDDLFGTSEESAGTAGEEVTETPAEPKSTEPSAPEPEESFGEVLGDFGADFDSDFSEEAFSEELTPEEGISEGAVPEEEPEEEIGAEFSEADFEEPVTEDFDLSDFGEEAFGEEEPEPTDTGDFIESDQEELEEGDFGEPEPTEGVPEEQPEEEDIFSTEEFSFADDEELEGGFGEEVEESDIPLPEEPEEGLDDLSAGFGGEDLGEDLGDFGAEEGFAEGDFQESDDFGFPEEPEGFESPEEAPIPESPEEPELGEESPEGEFPGDFGDEFGEDIGGTDEFSDEFSMGDFGAEFGIMEEHEEEEEEEVPTEQISEEGEELSVATTSDEAKQYALSDEEFAQLQRNLALLPLNLKIEIEQAVTSNKYPFDSVKQILDALLEGKNPQEVAAIVSKIVGKRLRVPRGYIIRSGLAFEKERQSFAYQFRENILPILRLVIVALAAIGLLAYAGYNYVYKPLQAAGIYELGIENIYVGQYAEGNRLFNLAYDIWPDLGRYDQYARAFRDERQFQLAREKYEAHLLLEPLNKELVLEYGDFATYTLRDYASARDFQEGILAEDKWDLDVRLQHGDTHMEWARFTEDEQLQADRYEIARYDYAGLIDPNGANIGMTDQLLFRMLRYFLRTDNEVEVNHIKEDFLNAEELTIEPRIYSELGGYLISKSAENPIYLEESQKILLDSNTVDDAIPETHYHLARLYRELNSPTDEAKALRNSILNYDLLESARPLDRFETARQIDSYIRQGELHSELNNTIEAEQSLIRAEQLYQKALENRAVSRGAIYGRLYSRLGDIYYEEGNDYEAAKNYYLTARDNNYARPDSEDSDSKRDMAYKLGYIFYREANGLAENEDLEQSDRLDRSIEEFQLARGPILNANQNLLYSMANAQFLRNQYETAASQYRILLDQLNNDRASIATFLLEEDNRHRSLIDFQIRVNNNLGVTYYKLYEQGGPDAGQFLGLSQLYLTRSTELQENVLRDPDTAVRADAKGLAIQNLRSITVPGFESSIQIDLDIRKDLETPFF